MSFLARIFAALLLARGVDAWWATGHLTVAAVAQSQLTSTANRTVARLLALSTSSYPYESELPSAADWMDLIKASTDAFSAWHYADAPLVLNSSSSRVTPSPAWTDASSAALVSDGANLVWALSRCFSVLQSESRADAAMRALFLRALLHFMGDLHQPCHCASLTLRDGSLDAGANLIRLSPAVGVGGTSSASNLHAFWDAGAGVAAAVDTTYPAVPQGSAGVALPSLAAFVASLSADVAAAARALPPLSVAALTNRTGAVPRAWHAEGVALAASRVYSATPVGTALLAGSLTVSTTGAAWGNYTVASQALARQQMVLGGVRLAAVLNALITYEIAPPPAPTPSPMPSPNAAQQCAPRRGAIIAAVLGWLAFAAAAAAGWLFARNAATQPASAGLLTPEA